MSVKFELEDWKMSGSLACIQTDIRVATVREKYLENEIFSKSGKSQGILWMVREI